MEIAAPLADLYESYYAVSSDDKKRALSALDSADHLVALLGDKLGNVIDVGAGNGSLLDRIHHLRLADSLSALEISSTGLERIKARAGLPLKHIKKFDGYRMPFSDNEFDTAISVHVVEHVEHERLFLKEISRIARRTFIEIPLEGGFRGRVNRAFGHINYYTPMTFTNLIETAGLRIIEAKVFTSSRQYEIFNYGSLRGSIRSVVRNGLLRAAGPDIAPHLMTYLLAVAVETA
jgi:SAM-dependent methyltransferase